MGRFALRAQARHIRHNTNVSQSRHSIPKYTNNQQRTSIRNIDPDTLWDAKIYAAQTKQTMGEVITEALQRLMQEDDGLDVNTDH